MPQKLEQTLQNPNSKITAARAPKPFSKSHHALPPRDFFLSTVVPPISSTLQLAGAGLSFFETSSFKLAGACVNAAGFAVKKIHDHHGNKEARNIIQQQEADLLTKIAKDNLPVVESFRDNFGLKIDAKLISVATLNTVIQIALFMLTVWNIASTWNEGENENFARLQWVLFALTLNGYAIDALEQHFKKDNLNRRNEQLNNLNKTNLIDLNSAEIKELSALPARGFLRSTFFSIGSNTLILTGTALGFFDKNEVKIAGAICNALGFSIKQLRDYLDNTESRSAIYEKSYKLTQLLGPENFPSVEGFLDNIGLKDNFKYSCMAQLNTLLQLVSLALGIWNTCATWSSEEDAIAPVSQWVLLTTTLLAYALDSSEQHLKRDNLSRRYEQLVNIENDLEVNARLSNSLNV